MTDQERGQAGAPGAEAPRDAAARESGGPEATAPDAVGSEAAAAHAGGEQAAARGEGDGAMEELAALQRELEALNDRHLRLAAEFDNYRKRIERERTETWARAQGDLAKRLLESLDDLQRVSDFDAAMATAESLLEGIQLVEKKLRHALESAGLEPIDPQGEFFNPETMEALMTVPAERPEEDEIVLDVFQKGYRFKGLLIRPA